MSNKRILITGGSGLVGRNIIEHQFSGSYELLVPSSNELNLLNSSDVIRYLSKNKPDVIIHSAGKVGGIQANIRAPVHFLVDNFDMGRNLILAAQQLNIKQLINLGSSCMYPKDAQNPLKEEMVLTGELEPTNEAYAIAKIAVARLCAYVSQENPEFEYKTLIPCNLYGRFDKFDPKHSHMLPAIIHKLHLAKLNKQSIVEIWGDGNARREFMYAADLADCVWRAITNFDTLPTIMNVGVGSDLTVNEYYREAADVVGYTGDYFHDVSRPTGMKQKLVSTELAGAWGWRANTSLTKGLTAFYKYYLEVIGK